MKTSSLVILVSLLTIAARADVSMPALFSDHMVLQAKVAAPVWGFADADEKVTVTIDSGDAGDIHPKNKPEVGRRLALWALAKVYGQDISFSGPLPAGHETKGAEVICTFTHAEGLAATGEITGFTLAGADKIWHPATARIQDGKVIVSSPEIAAPIALRYAWAAGNSKPCAPPCSSASRSSPWKIHATQAIAACP